MLIKTISLAVIFAFSINTSSAKKWDVSLLGSWQQSSFEKIELDFEDRLATAGGYFQKANGGTYAVEKSYAGLGFQTELSVVRHLSAFGIGGKVAFFKSRKLQLRGSGTGDAGEFREDTWSLSSRGTKWGVGIHRKITGGPFSLSGSLYGGIVRLAATFQHTDRLVEFGREYLVGEIPTRSAGPYVQGNIMGKVPIASRLSLTFFGSYSVVKLGSFILTKPVDINASSEIDIDKDEPFPRDQSSEPLTSELRTLALGVGIGFSL